MGVSGPFTLPPRIGLPTQVYPELPLGEALERLAPFTQLVEIDSFGLHTVLSLRNRSIALGSRLRLTVHGPYGHNIDPANPDESLRRFTVDQHRRHLEASAELGALVYVAHSDYRVPPAPRDPARVDAMQRTVSDLEELQREFGVPIGVENMPGVGIGTFTGPGDLDLGELGLVLDCGHAAISGTLDAFLSDPHGRLIHLHLHSNEGMMDTDDPHAPLGQGAVDAPAALALASAAGATVILEHLDEEAMLASLAYIERHGLADLL